MILSPDLALLDSAAEDAGQFEYASLAGTQGERGGGREAEGQAACWGASSVASEPDPASRCCGEPMPALPGGCLWRHADAGSDLRPDRDSRDQTRRDTGRIARRHVPVLRQAIQSRAAGGA